MNIEASLGGWLLAVVRFSAFLFTIPLLNNRSVPAYGKIGLAALLAFLILPEGTFVDLGNLPALSLLVMQEIVVGLVMSMVVTLIFGLIYFAGQLIDVPMGFGLVSVFDPQTGLQLPVFSQFFFLLGALTFLAVDGHLWLIKALAQSFQFLPIGSVWELEPSFQLIMDLASNLFSMGLQVALPVIGTIFVTDVALGIITRTVPQINVFVLGFPIKIAVGLFIVSMVIPFFVTMAGHIFGIDGFLYRSIYSLLNLAGGLR